MTNKNLNEYRLFDVLAVLASFFVGLFLAIGILIVKKIFQLDSISSILGIPYDVLNVSLEYFVSLFVVMVVYFLIIKKYKLNWVSFGFQTLPIQKTISYVVISFIITFAVWVAIAPFIIIFFPYIDLGQSQEVFDPDMHFVAEGLLVFYAIIVGPFIEEIIFRGVVFPGVNRNNVKAVVEFLLKITFIKLVIVKLLSLDEYNKFINTIIPQNKYLYVVLGLFFSTLIWSLLHFQINVIIFTFIFGIILGYIYYKSKSLWPSYITHVLKNLMAVMAIYALGMF